MGEVAVKVVEEVAVRVAAEEAVAVKEVAVVEVWPRVSSTLLVVH